MHADAMVIASVVGATNATAGILIVGAVAAAARTLVHPGPSPALPEPIGHERPLATVVVPFAALPVGANAGGHVGSDISDYGLSLSGASFFVSS